MISRYNQIHAKFKLNNSKYTFEELKEVAYSHVKEGLPFERHIGDFLIDWLNDNDYIITQTSGSTGAPKSIKLRKQSMVHSALATGDFFKLKPGDKALHCLPSNFIAGKMMLVRALILGLELDVVDPKTNLIFNSDKDYDFCAMLPIQLDKNLDQCSHIKTIIVGGAPVSEDLKIRLKTLYSNVYETYGMTETITHIALKKINSEAYFKVLPNIKISQDHRDCLVIEAPSLTQDAITTNDVVKLHAENEFEWLGRFDTVINSGGLKLHPEYIESVLAAQIKQRFFVASEPDSELGERLILVVEGDSTINLSDLKQLSKHQRPKRLYTITQFIDTPSGKLQRQKTLALLK